MTDQELSVRTVWQALRQLDEGVTLTARELFERITGIQSDQSHANQIKRLGGFIAALRLHGLAKSQNGRWYLTDIGREPEALNALTRSGSPAPTFDPDRLVEIVNAADGESLTTVQVFSSLMGSAPVYASGSTDRSTVSLLRLALVKLAQAGKIYQSGGGWTSTAPDTERLRLLEVVGKMCRPNALLQAFLDAPEQKFTVQEILTLTIGDLPIMLTTHEQRQYRGLISRNLIQLRKQGLLKNTGRSWQATRLAIARQRWQEHGDTMFVVPAFIDLTRIDELIVAFVRSASEPLSMDTIISAVLSEYAELTALKDGNDYLLVGLRVNLLITGGLIVPTEEALMPTFWRWNNEPVNWVRLAGLVMRRLIESQGKVSMPALIQGLDREYPLFSLRFTDYQALVAYALKELSACLHGYDQALDTVKTPREVAAS